MEFSFLESLIIGLIGLLFFKEEMMGWVRKKFGMTEPSVPPWASELKQYFNHDTTGHHTETHEKLDKLNERMESHKDVLTDIRNSLANLEKYGIKCREK